MDFDLIVSRYFSSLNSLQIDAASDVLKRINDGEKRVYIMAPTGAGKSTLTIFLTHILMGRFHKKRILFLTVNKIVSDYLLNRLQQEEIGTAQILEEYPEEEGYYISTISGMLHNIQGSWMEEFDYIIADEAQAYKIQPKYVDLLNRFSGCLITFANLGERTPYSPTLLNQMNSEHGITVGVSNGGILTNPLNAIPYPVFSIESPEVIPQLSNQNKLNLRSELDQYSPIFNKIFDDFEMSQAENQELKSVMIEQVNVLQAIIKKLLDMSEIVST